MEIKGLIICLFIFLIICSCNLSRIKDQEKETLDGSFVGIASKDTSITAVNILGDDYYQFIFDEVGNYRIKWGDKKYSNLSSSSFEPLGNGYLNFIAHKKEYILLEQGCGQKCKYAVLLPLNRDAREKIYRDILFSNKEHNLILYEYGDHFRLEDFITLKTVDIILENICPAINKLECIRSISIENNKLIIKYDGENWSISNSDSKEKIINLN